jgi:hypothetical protein
MKQVCRGRASLQTSISIAVVLLFALASAAAAGPSGKSDRVITGTGKSDVLNGGPAADTIYGHAGNDRLDGKAGNDTLYGGHGNDVIAGGAGNDSIYARDGERDTVTCGGGSDTATVDSLDAVADCEQVLRPSDAPPPSSSGSGSGGGSGGGGGGGSTDGRVIRGTPGNDVLVGGSGNDRIYGEGGNDRIAGNGGNDLIVGGPGQDTIDAGPGADTIQAVDQTRDRIDCGAGRDSASTDRIDLHTGCESSSASPPPSPPPPSPPPPSPPPPPAPPPPSPPPPPSSGGTTLTFTNTTWTCSRPITQLATNGLPLRVVMNYTQNYNGFGVRLDAGCVGDGTNAIDLVLNVNGDGLGYGPQEDAIRVMNELPGASNLQITGYANCGRKVISSIHQDGIQVLGGTNITWIDFRVGNYDAGRSTCQGAGGAFFYSMPSNNTRVQGGKFIACNHGLLAGSGSGNVSGASFRSGRNDGSDPACNYNSAPPCLFETSAVSRGSGVTCQRWDAATDRWVDS